MTLNVAREFSDVPGPRSRDEGPYSGAEFLDALLLPEFNKAEACGEKLIVVLDGASGYGTSFLEESFGGLARKLGSTERVSNTIVIVSKDEPYLCDDISKYIREAFTGAKAAQ